MHLSELARPFIVCVLTDRSVDATVATMETARYEGAHAYELNLPLLATAEPDDLARVFAATGRPVYTSCRRAAFMKVYGVPQHQLPDWCDEERLQRQLDALALGSVAIDMEMDAFDPHPAPPQGTQAAVTFAGTPGEPTELTEDAAAIQRQRQMISAAHDAGGEVILSCHTGRAQSSTRLVELAQEAAERGADLVKIVSPCLGLSDLFALLTATALLKTELSIPFTLIGAGETGNLSRTIGVLFGSGWAIGQQSFTPGGFHPQPLVAHLREILRLIPWRYTPEVKEGLNDARRTR